MRRCVVGRLLLLAALAPFGGCTARETHDAKDTALAEHVERLVEVFLTSEDDAIPRLIADAKRVAKERF